MSFFFCINGANDICTKDRMYITPISYNKVMPNGLVYTCFEFLVRNNIYFLIEVQFNFVSTWIILLLF